MARDVSVIRAIEAALGLALVAAVWALIHAGFFGSTLASATGWWASHADGLFSVEVTEVGEDAPGPGTTPDRIDVGDRIVAPGNVEVAPAPDAAAGSQPES